MSSAPLGGADLVEGRFTRKVHHVERCTGDRGDRDSPAGGLTLELGRPRHGMILRLTVPCRDRLALEYIDHVAVLAVHHGEQPVLRGAAHHGQQLRIVQLQTALVGHEHLDRRNPPLRQMRDLVEHIRARVGDRHVKTVIDAGLALGQGVPGVEGLPKRTVLGLDHEVDVRRGPAEGRGDMPCAEVVGRRDVVQRHVEVGVHVDAPGQQIASGGVDDADVAAR